MNQSPPSSFAPTASQPVRTFTLAHAYEIKNKNEHLCSKNIPAGGIKKEGHAASGVSFLPFFFEGQFGLEYMRQPLP